MNREQAKALLPIIQAFADGKAIQVNIGCDNSISWVDLVETQFDRSPDSYRIKTEPREYYIVQDKISKTIVLCYTADKNGTPACDQELIKVREVLEDSK